MSHVVDSQQAKVTKINDALEKRWEDAADYLKNQFAHNIFSINGHINTIDNVVRLGIPLSWQKLEKSMKEMPYSENLVFKEHSLRPFRCAYYKLPDGEEIVLSPYGRSMVIPEFSILDKYREVVPDMSQRHLNHLDFPEMIWTDDGYVAKDGTSLKPGYTIKETLCGENPNDINSRGWRTVLCRWLTAGLRFGFPTPSPEQFEIKFGVADTLLWANHMGKRQDHLPF